MEQYTDDERVEDLKKWWSNNGASIIVGIMLGVGAIFGWQYWNTYRNNQAEQTSLAYDAFIQAVEKPDADQARERGQALLAEFANSPYAVLTALRLAKLAVDSGDNATAIQRLQWVIDHAKLVEFQDIARLRLARVQLATGQLGDAEKRLDNVSTASLTAELEELRGDVYLAGNDAAKARTAYTAALAAGGAQGILQLKLDNLAVPNADTVITAPTPPPPVTETVPTPEMAPTPESAPETTPASEPVPTTEPTPEPASIVEPASEAVPVEPTQEPVVIEPVSAPTPTAMEPASEPAAAEPASTSEPVTTEPVPATSTPVEPAQESVPVEPVPATEPAPTSSPSTSGPPS